MRWLIVFFAILSVGQALPNAKLTPGAVRTMDTNAICSTRTGTLRNVRAADRRKVFEEYGIDCAKQKCGQRYEVDHLVSLEIGGSNDVRNLWPQPYAAPGARQKDILENKLHKMICERTIAPAEAQKQISNDWWKAYKKYVRKADGKLGR